jgi:ankyrin repeat protein
LEVCINYVFIFLEGCATSTKLLLDYGADAQMRMTGGWTPAHCAAEGGHIEVLKILIEHRCPMYVTDDSGDTPADIAAVYGHNTAKRLLEKAVKD